MTGTQTTFLASFPTIFIHFASFNHIKTQLHNSAHGIQPTVVLGHQVFCICFLLLTVFDNNKPGLKSPFLSLSTLYDFSQIRIIL